MSRPDLDAIEAGLDPWDANTQNIRELIDYARHLEAALKFFFDDGGDWSASVARDALTGEGTFA